MLHSNFLPKVEVQTAYIDNSQSKDVAVYSPKGQLVGVIKPGETLRFYGPDNSLAARIEYYTLWAWRNISSVKKQ